MHEASLVESLLDQVADSVRQWQANQPVTASPFASVSLERVTLVVLEIGPLSGVEPELVRLAFERLAPLRGLAQAELAIEWVPLALRCESCGAVHHQARTVFQCPQCAGVRVKVERGEAVILKSIELQET
jgi:hydrogenase nickel incorporation protein HypA/HybF